MQQCILCYKRALVRKSIFSSFLITGSKAILQRCVCSLLNRFACFFLCGKRLNSTSQASEKLGLCLTVHLTFLLSNKVELLLEDCCLRKNRNQTKHETGLATMLSLCPPSVCNTIISNLLNSLCDFIVISVYDKSIKCHGGLCVCVCVCVSEELNKEMR